MSQEDWEEQQRYEQSIPVQQRYVQQDTVQQRYVQQDNVQPRYVQQNTVQQRYVQQSEYIQAPVQRATVQRGAVHLTPGTVRLHQGTVQHQAVQLGQQYSVQGAEEYVILEEEEEPGNR